MSREERKANARAAYNALMQCYPLTLDDIDGEEWRPISGYEDRYHISNYGRVKSFRKTTVRMLRPHLITDGYLMAHLCKFGKMKCFLVHRLVAEHFSKKQAGKVFVNHRDGNKFNNYVDNLEWCTHEENINHAFQNGLMNVPQGEKRLNARFKNEDILYIRENPDGLTVSELGRKFNIQSGIISQIQIGKSYKTAGGTFRKAKERKPRVQDTVRKEIRELYIKGSSDFGCYGLGKKFSITPQAVWKIIHTQD